jgi:hypothetical protein
LACSTSVSMRWRISGPRLTCSTKLCIALGKSFWVRVRRAHFCTDPEMSFDYWLCRLYRRCFVLERTSLNLNS